jgi:hypothetical protein
MAIGDCKIGLSQLNDADIGDLVRVTASFIDSSGALADPTSAEIIARSPTGSEQSLSVTKLSTGIYYAEQSIDEENTWWFRAKGAGAVEAAAERSLHVRATAFDSP